MAGNPKPGGLHFSGSIWDLTRRAARAGFNRGAAGKEKENPKEVGKQSPVHERLCFADYASFANLSKSSIETASVVEKEMPVNFVKASDV